MADSISVQLQQITDEYSKEVQEVTRKACKKVARKTSQTLRNTSPKSPGGGEYASGWAVKQEGEDTFIVHNKKKPGLTHLLENGHMSANQYGVYGRVPAYKHIKPAADEANAELIAEIEANL